MALGFMRRHKQWLYAFLWIVILAFIVLYIPAFTNLDSAGETLAEVGGHKIGASEFRKAYLAQRQRMQQLYQGRITPAMLKSLRIEEQVFDQMVTRVLVRLESERLGIVVDDQTLAREIAAAPEFQRDGRFVGQAELRRLAELNDMTLGELEAEYREALLRRRLEQAVTDGLSVSSAEVEREYRRRNEQVKLEYVQVGAAEARAQAAAAVSEADVAAHFQAHTESYRVPEKRVVSYLLVDPEALRARVAVTDGEIELYYREHTDEFREQEQVCASHILIKVKGSAEAKDGHDEAEARRLAEALQQKARAGADFAELAKASSEDQGSAPSGGDLGCFPRGRMVPEFDNVAFDEALAPGQISELAKTNFGFHVIRVQARKQDTVQPLTQARERIRQSLTGERLQTLSAERTDAVTVALSKGRTLEQVAAELGLTVQKSPPFARGEAPPALSPALGARAFALKPGQVDREGGQVGRGYAFVALGEVQPSRLPKLEEAQERVKADLADRKAFESARARAAELRARAEKEGLDRAAAASGLVRKETPALVGRGQPLAELGSSAALDEAVFALADKSLSEPLRTPTGWAVVRVIERKAADPAAFERERATLVGTLRSERRSRLFQAYLGQARERYKVERRSDVFRRLVG